MLILDSGRHETYYLFYVSNYMNFLDILEQTASDPNLSKRKTSELNARVVLRDSERFCDSVACHPSLFRSFCPSSKLETPRSLDVVKFI